MIRIARLFMCDGRQVQIEAEGGSAKEALSIVEAAAEELGCAPDGNADAGKAAKGKGGRPKKDAPTATIPPALPIAPPTVQQAFEPPASAPTAPALPPGFPPGPVATFSPAPPMAPPAPSVAFAPPPAPPAPPSPEFAARMAVQSTYNDLLQSVPAGWQASVRENADGLIAKESGGQPIGEMSLEQANAAVTALRSYRATCDAAAR